MNTSRKRLAMIGAAALTTAALAACGSVSSTGGGNHPAGQASGSASSAHATAHNRTDVAFTRTMVQVESQSAAMAGLAARRSLRPQMRHFAAHMQDQARRHDRQLRGWLRTWHQAAPRPWPAGASTWYPMGPGMMGPYWHGYWAGMGRGWDEMHRLYGGVFNTGWMAMMARSYATQIALAQRELRSGVSPQARAFARWTLAQRRADLSQMHRWYHAWGGRAWNGRDWWNGWSGWHWMMGRHGMMRWHQDWQNRNRSGWRGGWSGGCC